MPFLAADVIEAYALRAIQHDRHPGPRMAHQMSTAWLDDAGTTCTFGSSNRAASVWSWPNLAEKSILATSSCLSIC